MDLENNSHSLIMQDMMQCSFCMVKWTIAKKAKTKLTHIKSCFKKNPIPFEEIVILLKSNPSVNSNEKNLFNFFQIFRKNKRVNLMKSKLPVKGYNPSDWDFDYQLHENIPPEKVQPIIIDTGGQSNSRNDDFIPLKTISEIMNNSSKICKNSVNVEKYNDIIPKATTLALIENIQVSKPKIVVDLTDDCISPKNITDDNNKSTGNVNDSVNSKPRKECEKVLKSRLENGKKTKKKKPVMISSLLSIDKAHSCLSEKRKELLMSSEVDIPERKHQKFNSNIRAFGDIARVSNNSLWEMSSHESIVMSQPQCMKSFITPNAKSFISQSESPIVNTEGSERFEQSASVQDNFDFVSVGPHNDNPTTPLQLFEELSFDNKKMTAMLSVSKFENMQLEDTSHFQNYAQPNSVSEVSFQNNAQQTNLLLDDTRENENNSNLQVHRLSDQAQRNLVSEEKIVVYTDANTQTIFPSVFVNVAIQTENIRSSNYSNSFTSNQEIEYLKQQHNADIKLYTDAHTAEIESLRNQHSKDLAMLSSDPLRDIDQTVLFAEYKKMTETTHLESIEKLRAEWSLGRNNLETQFKNNALEFERSHGFLLKQIDNDHRIQLEELRNLHKLTELAYKEELNDKMLSEISQLEKGHLVYCQSINETHILQIADGKSQHANQLDFMHKNFEDQIKQLDYQLLVKEQDLTKKNVMNFL
jgi:hypothetical protein